MEEAKYAILNISYNCNFPNNGSRTILNNYQANKCGSSHFLMFAEIQNGRKVKFPFN